MGLLDSLMATPLVADPEKDQVIKQGLLHFGLNMLSTPGKFGNAFGQSGLAAMQGMSAYKKEMTAEQMRKMQLQQMQREQRLAAQQDELDAIPGKYMVPPSQPGIDATGGLETALSNPANAASPYGRQDMPGMIAAMKAAPGGFMRGLQLEQSMAKTAPQLHTWKPGDVVGTFENGQVQEKFRVPDRADPTKQTKLAQLQAELNALPPGDPMRQMYAAAIRKEATHAPAASVSVVNKQEGEEAKTVGKFFGDQYATVQTAGMQAQAKMGRMQRMEQLLSGYSTGRFTPLGKEIASAAQSLGMKIDPNLGNKEAAEALSNEMALEARNPAGGAGMPGAMSDQDRKFLQNIVPGLAKTPQGNKTIIETHKRLAKRDQEVAQLARDYRKKRGTVDEGFFDELKAHADKNPLFGDLGATPAAPVGWSIKPAP